MKSPAESSDSEHPADTKGELVTRADGSQVLKVKKRKRRSKQKPKKSEEKQDPFIKWTVISLLLALLFIPAIGAIVIVAKYNGKSFKELTESNIKAVTSSATVKINTVKVTPISATARGIDIAWADQSFLKNASFKALNTDILLTTFVSKDWIGEDIIAKQGEIHLQRPTNYSPPQGQDFVTSIYQFNALRCEDLNLHFGTAGESPVIKNLLATIRKTSGDQLKIVFQRGTVERLNWPSIVISSGIITNNKDNISLNAIIEPERGLGGIKINGLIEKSTNQTAALNIEITQFPLQELLGEGLTDIFQGLIDSPKGKLTYDFSKPPEEALRIEIPFQSNSLTMSQLPMFDAINKFTGDSSYKDPTSNHCTGTLVLTKNKVSITDLNFISNRLITIRGTLSSNTNGDMNGELQVGLPTDIITGSAKSAFSNPINGFQSTSVSISGNIHNPHDNLKEKLRSQILVTPKITPKVNRKLTPLEEFEALTR